MILVEMDLCFEMVNPMVVQYGMNARVRGRLRLNETQRKGNPFEDNKTRMLW
jgi:hypothetical protein